MAVHNIETMKSERNTAGLIEALKHLDDASVRRAAAEALGQVGNPQAAEALVNALRDPEESVRKAAIEALCKVGNADTFGLLQPLLTDPDENVRAAAIEAMIRIRQGTKWQASAGDKRTAESAPAAARGERYGIGDWFYAAACLPAEHIKTWYSEYRGRILAARIGLFLGGAILWAIAWAIFSAAIESDSTGGSGAILAVALFIGLFALAMKGWDWYSQYKMGTVGHFIKLFVMLLIIMTGVGMLLIGYWTGKGIAKLIFRE
jgi:hypothetical protein